MKSGGPGTPGYEGGDDCSGDESPPRGGTGPIPRRAPGARGSDDPVVARPRRLDFSDLDLPECLLIKPIRLWLHGPENWPLVSMQYAAHFGSGLSAAALAGLRGVIEVLNAGGRRTMHFHKAWCRTTTGDERALVALAAAVQAGDEARARAMALRLVTAPWQQPLLDDMAALAAAFTARGHRFVHLPPRGGRGAAAPVRISGGTPPRTAPTIRS
ncbi:MAG: hypothetical protein COW30_09605 [Rhodospirillales bacterium CG15_BIG_FIL_POST_REV_8_21_14_020_66_15]|nr:MAG: hypothetical protein COW30_09605 [Rhodospirillales bacterium CG15_BIG_FIL_POST_REV_8_21_14_020_66_15]